MRETDTSISKEMREKGRKEEQRRTKRNSRTQI